MNNLVRDLIEVALGIGVLGIFVSAVRRLRAGEIRVVRCTTCGRPTSRAYPNCKHCQTPRLDSR